MPIDDVRVISNIATGETGIMLAEAFNRLGAKVTLLLGPVQVYPLNKNIKLIRFKFFDELKNKLLSVASRCDVIIHTAAVSDYKPKNIRRYKINSGFTGLKIELTPTVKIINLLKRLNPSLCLIGFKFETGVSKDVLLSKARGLIKSARLDLAVANCVSRGKYTAYILDSGQIKGPWAAKKDMVLNLVKLLKKHPNINEYLVPLTIRHPNI